MIPERLKLLYVLPFPASPASFGAQRRIQGLMKGLARRHEISAVCLVGPDQDESEARQAMAEYCRHVVLVPFRRDRGLSKRLLQLRSLASRHSSLRHMFSLGAMQRVLDDLLSREAFELVVLEAPFQSHYRLRRAPAGRPFPRILLDEHNIEYDIVRQTAHREQALARRLMCSVDWRKLRREEMAAWRYADAVTFTSAVDESRARQDAPWLRSAVVSNAVDLDAFRPRPDDPEPDGETVLFFGAMDYYPNLDGIGFFLREVWPRLAASHPRARLKIVGPKPGPALLASRGPRVEVTGFVHDLRPHLASATVTIVPLRIGSGTRLKILEAMGMGKAVVSTPLGAEGIDAVPGRHLLLAEEPREFGTSVGRLLDDPAAARRMGQAGRALVEERYSWDAEAERLDRFLREVLAVHRVA